MARTVFAVFLLCGIVMGVGGWRLADGDLRGYRPTIAASLVAFLLAGVRIVAWVWQEGTLDYALIGLTVPLVTYGAIAYVLMDCPPDAAENDAQQTAAGDAQDALPPPDAGAPQVRFHVPPQLPAPCADADVDQPLNPEIERSDKKDAGTSEDPPDGTSV